jgi:Mitochondrial carrier protein.
MRRNSPKTADFECLGWFSSNNRYFLEKVLGSSSDVEVVIREVLRGIGGFLLIYPLLTASRRVAAYGKIIGMSNEKYFGVTHALYKITKNEGFFTLFRGISSYSSAVTFI